jgi:hypothetical protein
VVTLPSIVVNMAENDPEEGIDGGGVGVEEVPRAAFDVEVVKRVDV